MAKTAVISFGRMNPITTGHQKLVDKVVAVAKKERGNAFIFLSHSQDKKKNPLSYDQKIKFAQQAFGRVVQKSKSRTAIEVLKELQGKYDNIVFVVGSDRVEEFDSLIQKYNGKEYDYKSIKTVSAGERDPDATDVSGMSASKLRALAMAGAFNQFKKGMPPGLLSNAKEVYDAIRNGMGIKEETEIFEEQEFDNAYDAKQYAKKHGGVAKGFRVFDHRAGRSVVKFKVVKEETELDENKLEDIKKVLKKQGIVLQGSLLSMIAGMSPAKLDALVKGINAVKPLISEEVEEMIKELEESKIIDKIRAKLKKPKSGYLKPGEKDKVQSPSDDEYNKSVAAIKKKYPKFVPDSIGVNRKTGDVYVGGNLGSFIYTNKGQVIKEETELDEVLNVQQRMKKRMTMRRLKSRIKRGRRIAKYKMASKEKLEKRSARQARNIIRKRLAGKQGEMYRELPLASRQQLDKRLEKKKSLVKKIAKRNMPKIRKAELERLSQARKSRSEGFVLYKLDNKLYNDGDLYEMVNGLLIRIENEEISESAMANLRKKSEKCNLDLDTLKSIYIESKLEWSEETEMTAEQFAFSCVNTYIANKLREALGPVMSATQKKIAKEKASDKKKHDTMRDRARLVDTIKRNKETK